MMVQSVGIIGYGEVGAVLAAGIFRRDEIAVTVFDPALHSPSMADRASEARAAGLDVADSVADLVNCEVVLSVVTPRVAVDAGKDFLAIAIPGQMLIDMNSTDPTVKRVLAEVASEVGVTYVDGALVGGGIGLEGFAIPVLLAGADAPRAQELLTSVGMRAQTIGDAVGQAAAAKMLRGIVMKGLEALLVEAYIAAHRHGVIETLTSTVAETLDGFEARDLIGMLLSSHIRHCERRSVEVSMIRDVVANSDLKPFMSSGSLALFERSVHSGMDPDRVDPSDRIASSAAILSQAVLELERQRP